MTIETAKAKKGEITFSSTGIEDLRGLDPSEITGVIYLELAAYQALVQNFPELLNRDKTDRDFSIEVGKKPTGLDRVDEGDAEKILEAIQDGGYALVSLALKDWLSWMAIPNENRGGH